MSSLQRIIIGSVAAGSLACVSTASAGIVSELAAVTIENVESPQNFYRSIMLFPVDQQGEPITTATFDTSVTPGVFVGDESSNIERTIESFAYINDFGQPGNSILLIEFPMNALWSPGEMLSFRFTVNYEEGLSWKIDVQFSTIPTPGAAGLAVLAGLGMMGRRRRS